MKQRGKKVSLILTLLLAAGLFFAYGTSHWGWWLPCIFREITGLQCPGCGVSRMALALFRLDLANAFFWNPLIFCLLPPLVYLVSYLTYSYIRFGHLKLSKWQTCLCYGMVVCLLTFGILRNLW